ncbi:MAG: hypothetical protein AAGH81_05935 [Bacteroidota bacterium]
MKKFQQLIRWCTTQIKEFRPGKTAFKGAALGVLIFTGLLWLLFAFGVVMNIRDGWVLLVFSGFVLVAILLAYLMRWLLRGLGSANKAYQLALFISIPLLIIMSFEWMVPVALALLASLLGAAIWVLKNTRFKNLTTKQKVVTLLGLIIGLGGLIATVIFYSQVGFKVDPMRNAAKETNTPVEGIKAPSPAQKGTYPVKTLTYGSGKDRHRPEFGSEVNLVTDSVNGLPFIDDWDGFGGWWRETYWGFDSRALPLNARVWYPEGKGPFPLALIVHGNHGMQDYSDVGYAYLGELLASKGIILASIDENFINGSWSDIFGGLDKENDARGWLLLEHLRQFHEWNTNEGNPFYQKIDTSNLALIGHSRGGEAVAHAALFNALSYYPDDASVRFDYNYAIRSIVAIAPVDGQYQPGDTRTAIKDLDYFVIHGAQDADVRSFMGSQQYERVTFADSLYHFKSGLYVYGANHGQFNTSWGNNDTGNPFTGLLNLKQLLSNDDQLEIAKVYIGAFLDITLKNRKEYLPLFWDARKGKDWLPETIYLSQFEDSTLDPIANFDEDFDVSTTTWNHGKITSENLTVWREEEIQLKWQEKGSRALFLGWDYDFEDEEQTVASIPDSLIASYTIALPSMPMDSTSVLVFSIAESKEKSNPKASGKWVEGLENENNDKEGEEDKEDDAQEDKEDEEDQEDKNEEDKDEPKQPLDLTIQLKDSLGQKIAFPLSTFSPLQRTIEVVINKTGFIMDDKESEKVYQTFYFPFEELQKAHPNFDFTQIETLRFVFDKNENGVISIDNLGIMQKL